MRLFMQRSTKIGERSSTSKISSITAIGRRPTATTTFRRANRELSASRQSPSSRRLMKGEAMPQPRFLPLAIVARGRDDPETVKLTISIAIQSTARLKEESSLGAIPEMLYYNSQWSERSPDSPVKAHAGMKWFRSNIGLMSRLALFALAIQFLLSFGHFHGSSGQAAPALADAKQWALHDA